MKLAFSRIGLTGKPGDAAVHGVLTALAGQLRERGAEVSVEDGLGLPLDLPARAPAELAKGSDLIVCAGGDGSLLHAARQYGLAGLPLVGVNLGRLGFLVDVSPDRLEHDLGRILDGEFVEEQRLLLRMTARRGGKTIAEGVALNDVVLHKADPGRLLEFSTHIDGTGVTTHRADGMVVATPTGSTAYALSGGGPILHPVLDAIVLVPICPHMLSDRPVVVPAASEITLTVGRGAGGGAVSCDGTPGVDLIPGDTITVTRLERSVRLLHPAEYDFFRLLREKLHWGRAPD